MHTWTEEDTESQWHCWDESGANLETPSNVSDPVDSKIGAETEEDTKGSPSGNRQCPF
jgi:hypothetical protein